MRRLGNGDQIYGIGCEWRGLCRSGFVENVGVRGGSLDLGCTRVGSDNTSKVVCQKNGCLAISGGAIPCEVLRWAKACKLVEEGCGIRRSMSGVVAGVGREMIFGKVHRRIDMPFAILAT